MADDLTGEERALLEWAAHLIAWDDARPNTPRPSMSDTKLARLAISATARADALEKELSAYRSDEASTMMLAEAETRRADAPTRRCGGGECASAE